MNNEKIYIFDFGNVIEKPINVHKFYEALECAVSYEEFINYWENSEDIIKVFKGEISNKERAEKLLKSVKSKKRLEDYFKIYKKNAKTGFFEDTLDIITKIKKANQKVCMLSNLAEYDYEIIKEELDLKLFDELFLSYKMHLLKPDTKIYKEVIQKLNTNANKIVFFDDRKDNVEAAKACGINAFCVTGENIKEVFENMD